MVDDGAVIQDVLEHTLGFTLGMFYEDDGLFGLQDPEWL